MNAMMKLAAAALSIASIAGGVAVAQTSASDNDDARSQTANYGTPPGAPLKRDGSLSADPKPVITTAPVAADSMTTTTTETTSVTTPAAPVVDTAPAPVVDATPVATAPADTTLQPRADRN